MKTYLLLMYLASIEFLKVDANSRGLRVIYHDTNIAEVSLFENFTSQTYINLLNYHAYSYFAPVSYMNEYSGLVLLLPPTKGRWYFGHWRACSITFINDSLLHYKIITPFVAYLAADWDIPRHKVEGLPTLAYTKHINSSIIAIPW